MKLIGALILALGALFIAFDSEAGALRERLAERIADLGGQEVVAVRASLWRHLNAGGVNKPESAIGKTGAASPYVLFLRNFDVDFRIRRLRFLIRRVNIELTGADEATAAALGKVKAGLYAILAPHLMCWPTAGSVPAAGNAIADPASALAAVASALDIAALTVAAQLVPGAPLCRVWSDAPGMDGMEVVLKGGQMGQADFFGRVLHGIA